MLSTCVDGRRGIKRMRERRRENRGFFGGGGGFQGKRKGKGKGNGRKEKEYVLNWVDGDRSSHYENIYATSLARSLAL